jgi:small subunit ribosomal protein S17
VVSIAADKSAVVAVDTFRPHPIYKRRIRSTKKYLVHDEENRAQVGDVVEMLPSKPISKRKRFILGETVQKSK